MGTYRISVICFFGYILASVTKAASKDICESCRHIDDCPRYAEMSKEQQGQWIQNFSCNGPDTQEGTVVPGFSTVAKGDYVCCMSTPVWGIHENYPEPEKSRRDKDNKNNSNNFQVNNYPQYNQTKQNNNPFHSYMNGQAGLQNNPHGAFYNAGNNVQCTPQSFPPNPGSGCCGTQMTDNNMITDLQQFLQRKTTSKWGSHPNYSRYRRDSLPEDVTFEDRIAGGHKTNLDQYPWTALLNIIFISRNVYTRMYILCGGSLITRSSRFVLTAAHCMFNENSILDRIEVTLAEYDKRTFPRDCVNVGGRNPICIENLRISAENVIVHPNYNDEFLINDIALIQLQANVPYTRNIRPICLPPINIDSPQFSNLPLATAGWGLNVSTNSDLKQFTVIYMVPKRECSAYYTQLTAGHLCASGKMSEDTCKGDSGGPLMMMYQGKYYVVGIVSGKTAAFRCGTPVPSLYTNVYPYLDWIRYYVG